MLFIFLICNFGVIMNTQIGMCKPCSRETQENQCVWSCIGTIGSLFLCIEIPDSLHCSCFHQYFFNQYSFLDGLGSLGVLRAIQKHPQTFRECFIYKKRCLTAERIEELFKYSYSEEGSNKRRDEERTIGFWLDLLLDIEGWFNKLQKNQQF